MAKLLEREKQGSTFLNEGVALPHARIEGLERPWVALGLSHAGILDAYTETPVEIVFLLLSPREENRSHLQLLAVAGRMMLNRTLRNQLLKARTPAEAMALLADSETA
jgi:mannitol/fructose-specific phosphotransferase system IIA component (Ntr-type)